AAHWLRPSLWEILFSQDRSLFYWTPLCAVAFLGLLLMRPSRQTEAAALLLAAFGVQVYALGSVWGKGEYLEPMGNFAGAFLSKAYGMRHLTEAVVVLGPGLAFLLEWAAGRRPGVARRAACALVCACGLLLTLVNLLLVFQYADQLL